MNLGIFLFPKDREWRKEMKEREKKLSCEENVFCSVFLLCFEFVPGAPCARGY